MPSSLAELEVSALYGALDADAADAGEYVHAHVLRELGRQSRHEAAIGNYLVHETWRVDGASDVEAPGGRVFDAPPGWKRALGPYYPPRKRNLRTAELQVYARITDQAVVLMQIVTGGHARQLDVRSSSAPNVLRLEGTGAWEWYTLSDIRLGADLFDIVEVWVTADSQSGFDTASYGSPASGAFTDMSGGNLRVVGATWNVNAINAVHGRNVVRFLNVDGVVIVPDHKFVAFTPENLNLTYPFLTADQVRACQATGVTFELRTMPSVRIGAFILAETHGF